jgi:dTDP-4-dehydrorhamnose reductase
MQRILVTGAAGLVGSSLRPRLARPGRLLRLLDLREPDRLELPAGAPAEEVVLASVTDLDAMTAACAGVSAVVHLGGQSREAGAGEVIGVNGYGAYCALEAARRAGVTRVVLASSSHAVGFHTRQSDGDLPADLPPRPDTLYGWSKVAVEAAGRLYADRYGMDVVCLRIGLWFPTPPGLRGLAMWLSADDGARLVEACLAAESPGYRLVWGISRNTRRWWSLAEGEAIGYFPKDDAEEYAAALIAEHGEPDWAGDPVLNRVGGQWCDVPLGEPY